MLTLNCAKTALHQKSIARFAATVVFAAVMVVLFATAAHADMAGVGGCVGNRDTLNCAGRWGEAGDPYLRIVPPPATEEEHARAAEREHRWEQRCKPIVRQDRFGVARYWYAAPGCEFGILD